MVLVPTGRVRVRRLFRRRKPAQPKPLPRLREHPGRPYAKVPGSWVGDLADRRYTILLCYLCKPKFERSKMRRQYHPVRTYRVAGKCDDCREFRAGDMQAYNHLSLVGTHPGSVYDPRRE